MSKPTEDRVREIIREEPWPKYYGPRTSKTVYTSKPRPTGSKRSGGVRR